MGETLSDGTREWPSSTPLLWVEFLGLFVAAPLGVAFFLGVISPILVLMGLVAVALVLLARTPDFVMSDLLRGPVVGEWRLIALFTILTTIVLGGLALWLVPERFLDILRYRPHLWLMIMALYPVFSALPQEIVFRTLFFRRYGRLFPNKPTAIAVNAAVFGLAHLFFFHPITVVLTIVGGALFSLAYLRNGSTLFAVVLHAIAGQLVFTSGLGIFFYHGAIG